MKYRVEYFQPKEFICPCCSGGLITTQLAFNLDILRRAWNAPIRVNSGYRCEKHNEKVGGVKNSRHLLGLAADIAPVDIDAIGPFHTLVGYLFGRRQGWELKFYQRFVHIGVPREEKTMWRGGLLNINTGNATN